MALSREDYREITPVSQGKSNHNIRGIRPDNDQGSILLPIAASRNLSRTVSVYFKLLE